MPAGEESQTLPSWYSQIRINVYNILTSYQQVVIHRAKLACLCKELLDFHRKQANLPNRPVTPSENQTLHTLKKAILDMKKVYNSLTNDNWVQAILKQSSEEFKNYLHDFRETFNKCTTTLHFAETDPLTENPQQIRIDDNSDSQTIIERIDALMESSLWNNMTGDQKSIIQNRKAECQEKMEEYSKQDEASKRQKDQLSRVMEQEEVTRLLHDYEKWNIDVNDFELQKKIGSGSFADVYLGYQKSTGILVGFKKLKTQQFKYSDFRMYEREISIFSSLKHFAILPFVGASIQHPYCIVTEFMSNGSLFDRLHKAATPLDATHKTICALGIAQGMAYMHSKKILHRDLKSLNILLDSDDFPKICDFGMSREVDNGETVLTGGIGTYRWMAPEVMDSRDYDEKADVYSYAVVLWELLTQNIPFQGLTEPQVAFNVLQKDARPLFPQNCPQKIMKLIKKCWDKNPKNRPDFESIVKMFACGAISYPGTNQDQVNAYINQFSGNQQQQVGHFDPEKVSEKVIDQIITDLAKEQTLPQALAKLKLIAGKSQWHPLFRNTELIQLLINLMNTCQVAQISFDLVSIFYSFSSDKEMLNSFVRMGGSDALLELILKFGSTSMPKAIEALTAVINADNNIKLNAEHFAKLASFLGTTDIKIRISSTELICLALERKAFASDAALISVINSVLSNAILEAKSDLLKSTLKLIKLLLPLSRPAAHLARSKGPSSIFLLLPHSDPQVVADSLDILRVLCTDSLPSADVIHNYAAQFADVIGRNSDTLTIKALYLVGVLVRSPSAFKEFQSLTQGLRLCLSSKHPSIQAYTLQLVFAFLSNQTSTLAFAELTDAIVPHLAAENKGIAAIAASCLTVILMNKPADYGKVVYVKKTANFIIEALKIEEMQQCAIRLAGVISMTFAGARFLDSTDVMPLIRSLLTSSNISIKKLAFMAFASFSAALPLSKNATSAIPQFVDALEDQDVHPYPLLCITSITEVPSGPFACVSYLAQISKLLSINDDDTISKTFTTLINIFDDPSPKLKEELEAAKGIKDVVEATKRFWTSPVFKDTAFQLLECVSTLHIGRAALRKYEVTSFVLENIDDPKYFSSRKLFLKIIARTKALG